MNQVKAIFVLCSAFTLSLLIGCDFGFDLPDSNSKVDDVLPNAEFSYTQDPTDYRVYSFLNASSEATDYTWDFGTGDISNEIHPTYRFDGGEGTYVVTLTAHDANGATGVTSYTIEVIEPEIPAAIIPTILEAGFEDNELGADNPDLCGQARADGRDCWNNSAIGGIIQITGSPVYDGDQAAKFPSDGSRAAYQELLAVSPNTDYKFEFYYTLKATPVGSITFDVLGGINHTSENLGEGEVLGSFVGTDQTDANTYTEASLIFNTGANDMISIYIHNEGVEARLDLVSIEAVD